VTLTSRIMNNVKSQAKRYYNENVRNQDSILCNKPCTKLLGLAERDGRVSFWGKKSKNLFLKFTSYKLFYLTYIFIYLTTH